MKDSVIVDVRRGLATAALACLCSSAQAKTVALWPLGWDAANQRRDGHCEVSSENDLSFDSDLVCSYMTDGWGWKLPPNPDPAYPTVANDSALYSCGTSAAKNFAYSTSVGKYLTADKDFTLEGWFRFPTLPATNGKFFVADCGGLNLGHRWFLTFRAPSGTNKKYTWQIFFEALSTGDAVLCELSDADVAAITKGWHHWAFVFNHSDGDGQAVISFYQDGKLLGSLKKNAYSGGAPSGDRFFGLGCRDNKGDAFKGFLDYCRLSDSVLSPSEFLYAAKATTKTLAHWKLDKSADGGVNGAPSVGNARLYGGLFTNPAAWCPGGVGTYSYSRMRPDVDCAFAGNPPNPTVTLPNGNFGSMFACEESLATTIGINELGKDLSFVNDFTVEGWIKICRQTDSYNNYEYHHICGTRTASKGWCFQYYGGRGQARLELYANDGNVLANAALGSLADCEDRWIHVALSYDHADGDGKGVWRTYVDGVQKGSVTNSAVPADVAADSPQFRLGRVVTDSLPRAMIGKLDCWRVSKAALRPTQLMCASEGAEAVTAVAALWPLNAQNGAWLDGTDVVGPYTFESRRAPKYLATGTDDAPDVPGVSSPANGSALFNSGTAGSQSTLLCISDQINNLFQKDNADGWTIEWYVKRTAEPVSGKNEFLLLTTTPSTRLDSNPNLFMNLNYRPDGFWLYVKDVMSDTHFVDGSGKAATLPVGEWKHVALSRRVSGTTFVYELFVDGVSAGTITKENANPIVPGALQFGGRNSTENSWKGAMSSIRITRGALTPAEFLCAKTSDHQTAAFWPLDAVSGKADLSAQYPNGALAFVNATNVTGSDDPALARVPKYDVANVGSVSLAANSWAETPVGGECVDLTVPFTVEGWLKVPQALSGRPTIVGNFANKGGWKLLLDMTGAKPALVIFAKGTGERCMIVEKKLMDDASAFLEGWHHLALTYDPSKGNGVWSLMVDRHRVGTPVENTERPVADFATQLAFRIGSDDGANTCAGLYDMWRVSTAVLAKSELLYPPSGMLFLVR